MIDLLVGVYVGGLLEHFVRLLRAVVLVQHFDASCNLLHVGLLVAQFALLDRLLGFFVHLLEVALGL